MVSTKRQLLAIVCRDLTSVRAVTDATAKYFELVWIGDSKALISAVSQDDNRPFAVIVDQAMPSPVPAVEMLQSVQTAAPSVKRVLLTDHCDLGIIISGLHTGAVQSIVYKPIHPAELLFAIGAPNLPTAMNAAPPRARGQHAPNIRAVG